MAAIDLIPSRYREVKTARNEIMSTLMAQVETKMLEIRTRFDDLVWEAYDRDKETISSIARAMGGSRTSVYEIIKKRQEFNETHGAETSRVEIERDGFRTGNERMPQFRVRAIGAETRAGIVDLEFTTWWTGDVFFVSKHSVTRGDVDQVEEVIGRNHEIGQELRLMKDEARD